MRPFIGVALYFTLWWLALFAVLPWASRPHSGPDDVSGWRGVPLRLRLWRVAILTSALAAVFWLLVWVVVQERWVRLDSGWMAPNTSASVNR
ncbi:MAG: DUF1467 family protein [Alphaproteobacteria bacterium]|nr:DUF1467 family protein [Alphaproteobacteria bacterium]